MTITIKQIEIYEGEKLDLNITYSPTETYKNATLIYSVEDTSIAKMNGNTIEGIKEGITTLHMSTQEFGGNKEILVSVIKKNNGGNGQNERGGRSSHDNYGNGGGTGISYLNNLIAMQQFVIRPIGTPNSWLYNPIDNVWYRIGADGQAMIGWFQEGNKWYFFGEKYIMLVGYNLINGKWYYFAETDNQIIGKVKGALYVNEMTPIGVIAGADGSLDFSFIE